jgi:hypothetical protein
MNCPNCKQDAPTVVRGMRAFCTACGAPRSLLDDTPVNVAGKPARIGGSVASVLGSVILIGGLLLAFTVGALLQALFAASIVGYVIGSFLGGLALLFGLLFLLGGRALRKTGTETEQSAHELAVFALARRKGGSVTPAELARAIRIPEAEADALLTTMCKRADGKVSLEVDDDGTLRYFIQETPGRIAGAKDAAPRMRVPSAASAAAAPEPEEEALAEAEADEAHARSRLRR